MPNEIVVMFLALGILLSFARFLGELARRFNQPTVLGEILAGILLGPTVLGAVAPEVTSFLFPNTGHGALVLDGLTTLAVVLFLLVAGMGVDLSTMWKQGRAATSVGVSGIVVPFGLGFLVAWYVPHLVGREQGANPFIFGLFFATALSITALPVIAKILMDLNLYRSDLGMIVVAAAVFNDLIGWIIFAAILSLMDSSSARPFGIVHTLWLTLGFTAVILTVGRWLINRSLSWLQAHTSWPGGVLAFALSLALFGAAFTEWIGIHAIFGSFLVGIAVGDSFHLREQTRSIINEFVSFIFAPLFFASIGLKVNFAAHFDVLLVLVVLMVACVGKILGCGLGARWSGMTWQESWAIGFGMNARGNMEIILGLLALQYGVIGERMFVALVVMALGTTMMGGPVMQRVLRWKKPHRFIEYLAAKAFLNPLRARDRREAIKELVAAICTDSGQNPEVVERAVWVGEGSMPKGISNGLAVPHARLDRLSAPLVGVGLSTRGIDFDASDGEPARIICLILTPKRDDGAQLELILDVVRTLKDAEMRERVLQAGSYAEFLALVKGEQPPLSQ
jgi:Kef-type K+ transport system membrane component KefB/mannitol/fructose-specific phosphotransferase system IIA component (Ntr-type)